jgi:hypothetical protein
VPDVIPLCQAYQAACSSSQVKLDSSSHRVESEGSWGPIWKAQ